MLTDGFGAFIWMATQGLSATVAHRPRAHFPGAKTVNRLRLAEVSCTKSQKGLTSARCGPSTRSIRQPLEAGVCHSCGNFVSQIRSVTQRPPGPAFCRPVLRFSNLSELADAVPKVDILSDDAWLPVFHGIKPHRSYVLQRKREVRVKLLFVELV